MTARETECRADYYCGLFKTTETKSMHFYQAPGATFAGFKLAPKCGNSASPSFNSEKLRPLECAACFPEQTTKTTQRWLEVTHSKGGGGGSHRYHCHFRQHLVNPKTLECFYSLAAFSQQPSGNDQHFHPRAVKGLNPLQ